MVETKTVVYYIFFLVIYSFFVTGFQLEQNENLDITKYAFFSNTFNAVGEKSDGLFDVLRFVLIPFMVIDLLAILLTIISITFVSMPTVMNILILSPVGIIVILEYIVPTIRGN